MRTKLAGVAAIAAVMVGLKPLSGPAVHAQRDDANPLIVSYAARHAVSLPLRKMESMSHTPGLSRAVLWHRAQTSATSPSEPSEADLVVEQATNQPASVTLGMNFDGIGQNAFNEFTDSAAPPDTTASVGATQVVQWVNDSFAVLNGTLNWDTRIGSFALANCTTTNPTVEITSVPPFGSSGFLGGQVSNAIPADYEIAVLLFVPGLGWYSKPYCDQLFTQINPDGTWSTTWMPAGADNTATKYVAYLVPQGFRSTCYGSMDGFPADLEAQAAARAFVTQTNPSGPTVNWSGYTWDVTTNSVPLNPGPCTFSSNNVSVDSQGFLHLLVSNASGAWTCAQIASQQPFGYGTYTFYVNSPVDNLDPNVVAGLFTWSDDPAYVGFSPWVNNPAANIAGSGLFPSHSELDIEFSKFGNASDTNNAQFAVQPFNILGNVHRYPIPSGLKKTTHRIMWKPGGLVFGSFEQNGTVIQPWSYPGAVPPPADNGGWPGPVPAPQSVRLNLWLFNGVPPSNGQPAEVVVGKFVFIPASL